MKMGILPMTNTKVKYITLLAVVLIIGGALGFIGGQAYQKKITKSNRPSRGNFHQRYMNDLKTKLNLTEIQVNKIELILTESRKKTWAEFQPLRERIKEIRKEVVKQIESVLTDEQRTKFQEFRQKQEEESEKRRRQDGSIFSNDTSIKRRNK